MAFDKVKYDNDYKRQNYDRIILELPKGKKQILKELAEQEGTTIKQILVKSVEGQYNINLTD